MVHMGDGGVVGAPQLLGLPVRQGHIDLAEVGDVKDVTIAVVILLPQLRPVAPGGGGEAGGGEGVGGWEDLGCTVLWWSTSSSG